LIIEIVVRLAHCVGKAPIVKALLRDRGNTRFITN